jgi:hypothetical protein
MKYARPAIPAKVFQEFKDAADEAGFTSLRSDAKLSRWTYLKKLLALGRQYKDVLKAN